MQALETVTVSCECWHIQLRHRLGFVVHCCPLAPILLHCLLETPQLLMLKAPKSFLQLCVTLPLCLWEPLMPDDRTKVPHVTQILSFSVFLLLLYWLFYNEVSTWVKVLEITCSKQSGFTLHYSCSAVPCGQSCRKLNGHGPTLRVYMT